MSDVPPRTSRLILGAYALATAALTLAGYCLSHGH